MKATVFSAATLATAASAAPLLDSVLDTVDAIVGNVPVVGDLLENVPATDILKGVFAVVPADELVDRLPIQEIVAALPVNQIVSALPLGEIVSAVPIKRDVEDAEEKVEDVTDFLGDIPLLGGLLDTLPATDLLHGLLSTLSVDDLLDGLDVNVVVNALPVKDVIARLPVGDIVSQLPVAGDVAQNLPVKRVDLGTVPIVGALLQRIPVTDLVDALVARLPVDGIVSRLPVNAIVARLPVKDIVAVLPADLPVKRAEINVVSQVKETVTVVKEHTKTIKATVSKVEAGKVQKKVAETTVIKHIDELKVDLTKVIADLKCGEVVEAIDIDVLVELVGTLVGELVAIVKSLTVLDLHAQLIAELHGLFALVANLLSVLAGLETTFQAALLPVLKPILGGFDVPQLVPVLTPIISVVVGIVPV